MRFNLKLLHQGLILILLPIAFELAFIPELATLLAVADREMSAETHRLAVIDEANHLIFQFGQVAIAARLYHVFLNRQTLDNYESQLSEIKSSLCEFNSLVKDYPKEAAQLERICTAATLTLDSMNKSVHDQTVEGPVLTEIDQTASTLASELHELVKQQKTKEATTGSFQKHCRQNAINFLLFGAGTNLLLGLFLALLFNKTIVRRISVLMENTRRLAQKKPLLARIDGNDEVGQVDALFHEMADSLYAAAKKNEELMKTVGQDLRAPLTGIKLSLAALSEGVFGELPQRAHKEVSISEFNTARLINLISDLVDIEKLDSGKLDIELVPQTISGILQESVAVVKAYASKKQIALRLEPTDAPVMADRNRLVQVLVNLLSNAVKFSPKGSTVTLAAVPVDGYVEVRVSDMGRGVPEESRESIFERFKQVRKEDAKTEHGAGLGLAICKAIVAAHGGSIGVNSTMGSGSTFWFRIPACSASMKNTDSMQHFQSGDE